MLILADTHVHFYRVHELERWTSAAVAQLDGPAPHAKVLCLTERHDCRAFAENWLQGERVGDHALRIAKDGREAFVIAGRQIVTRERLEVLSLTSDAAIADGQPVDDVLKQVRDAGGLPVLAWAPGKWFFARGKIIARLLEEQEPGSLLVGDSSLRPTLWPDPDLMTYAHGRGFNVIAGSDPLPFKGDEKWVGAYGVCADAPFDVGDPAGSMRAVLGNPQSKFLRIGRRSTVLEVAARLRGNARSKRGG